VIAKVPDGTTPATAKVMLQALLADRFGLVIHKDTRPVPRYVLSVGKGGSKLKPASGSGKDGCQPQQQAGGRGVPGDPASIPNIKVACHNLTAAAIAENLHQMAGGYLDHDVIDSTRLDGSWDFDIEWTGRGALAVKGAEGISVFDAVDKQLGLKLELQNIPLPSLAIETVNRKPTASPEGIAATLALASARFEAATGESLWQPHDPGSATAGSQSCVLSSRPPGIDMSIFRQHGYTFHQPARPPGVAHPAPDAVLQDWSVVQNPEGNGRVIHR
jgi:uncharacterized protein (TIGR03435 family)